MTTIGYARVSTGSQSLDSQLTALAAAGCTRTYSEKLSGKDAASRPELNRMLKAVGNGDTVVVTRLDRLARSTLDLLSMLDKLGKSGVGFRSLADSWCDTTSPHGRLMITILGGLAEFERSLILSRTSEGIKRAKANGVKFGRKPKLDLHQRREAMARLQAGDTASDIARTYGVSYMTILRLSVPA